jgi:hypothetical protein
MTLIYSKNMFSSGTLLKTAFANCRNTAAKVSSHDGFSSSQNCFQLSLRTLFVLSPVNVENVPFVSAQC